MTILATICARGGSKGVPRKNIRMIAGKPLIAHTIEQARNSGHFSAVGLSSDDPEILQTARDFGIEYVVERPSMLASDIAPKLPAIRHCVEAMEAHLGRADIVVDLDPTSPLRALSDIDGALQLLQKTGCPNVITGCRSRRSPYFNLVELTPNGEVELAKQAELPIRRRQDAPITFDMNASIYVWQRDELFASDDVVRKGTRLFEMPDSRSHDIDTELDFQIVELLLMAQRS